VVFEPARIRTDRVFKECLEVAHVVKYSYEQVGQILSRQPIPLEIQTLGAEGLRFRHSSTPDKTSRWVKIPAFHIFKHVDSAGAGDWCTAGVVHMLGRTKGRQFEMVTDEEIDSALRFGQALAALKCSYEGPRGMMYEKTSDEVLKETAILINGESNEDDRRAIKIRPVNKVLQEVCPTCARSSVVQMPNARIARYSSARR
jgi:fructokinase